MSGKEKFEFKFRKVVTFNKEQAAFYNELKKSTGSPFHSLEGQFARIFITAMALGFKYNLKKEVKSKGGEIPTYVFTNEEKWMMISIYMKKTDSDLQALREPNEILNLAEEYAAGGIEHLEMMYREGKYAEPINNLEDEFLATLKK